MPIDINSIADDTSTLPANAEAAPADDGAPQIPEEVLALPIFAGILSGAPAALYTPTGDKSHESVTAVKFQKPLADAGIFLYRDKPSGTDLIFNAQFITLDLIKAAIKKGKISSVASPLAETAAAFNGAPAAGGGNTLPVAGAPSPVPLDSALNTARVGNLSPGGPTSGPNPGAGRVLNGILTPTV